MSFFREIIFKPKEKPAVALLPPTNWNKKEVERNLMFETLYCNKKGTWLSAIRCLDCEQRTISVEEILRLGDGCE